MRATRRIAARPALVLWSRLVAEPAPTPRRLAGTTPVLVLIFAGGCALRFWHLGAYGLWWDEIVHVWTAQRATVADVWREAKQGIPPGSGNAGAVPLDYVLLHLYLRLVPLASPDTLEIHFRLPAFVYGCLALPLLYAFARRFLDRPIAVLATLLLALSTPHVLYSAEARFYALFVLLTIADLYAFAHLLERRDALGRWAVYGLVNAAYFLSGLLGLLVLAVQYAVLGVLAAVPWLRRSTARGADGAAPECSRAARRELGAFLACSTFLAVLVATYFSDIALGFQYRRNPARIPRTLDVTWSTLLTLSSDERWLRACLLLWPVPLVWAWRRRTEVLALVVSLELTLLAIPVIVELARWKRYYFHPRHALFLLPAVEILTAITLLAVVRTLDPSRWLRISALRRDAWQLALACALVLGLQLPTARAYVQHPERFFSRSKKTYDVRGVTRHVREAVYGYAPRDKYLLIAQRNVMGNTTLAQYLRWYGLGDRVVFRGTPDPARTLERAREVCKTGCLGERGPVVDRALGLTAPFGLPVDFQRLLGLLQPIGLWPGSVRHLGIVAWSPIAPPEPQAGWLVHELRGVELLELAPRRAPSEPAGQGAAS